MNAPSTRRRLRVAAVSFLNAKPLLYGLQSSQDVDLSLDVPSRLIDRLADASADIALLPVIDYQKLDDLLIVPVGGIGCDGPTLTVRLFSKSPIESIRELACDADSHTSVALAKIILGEAYGIRPTFVPLSTATERATPDSLLLIGDKVICEQPIGFDHQLDLGDAWKQLTGLPFVFAVWTARGGIDLRDLPDQLEHCKQRGLENVDSLVREFALPRGWPAEIARQYMTSYLRYDIGPLQLEAIRRFYRYAADYKLIDELRPLREYPAQCTATDQ